MTSPLPTIAGVAAVAAVLGLGGTLGLCVQPSMDNAPSGMNAAQQERLDKAASASLFGQFRSSMADFLWLKVDKYLHNGVDLRGLTPLEREAKTADKVTSSDKGQEGNREHHGDETTVVPSAARDWRGPYGDIERAVQPYKNMEGHTHRDPKEALPLFRLMTWSNPHFVTGYVTGASMIARDSTRYQDAIDFLLEGERNNPESLEIETALGMMYTAKLHQYATGVPFLTRAIALGAARDRQTFTEDEAESYEGAYRWLVLNRREANDPAAAHAAAVEGKRLFPDDVVCRDYLRDH
jgi:hypothetical protein